MERISTERLDALVAPVQTDKFYEPPTIGEGQAMAEELLGFRKRRGLDTDEQVLFYEQEFYPLSNFSSFNLYWHTRTFPTSEHAYHWTRFATGWSLGDADGIEAARYAKMIMVAASAHEAFKIAQDHKSYQRPDWDDVKVELMLQILFAKAHQHEYVRRKLLQTGNRLLIENSWRDDFWGWGESRNGKNMLGTLWMEVRRVLIEKGAV